MPGGFLSAYAEPFFYEKKRLTTTDSLSYDRTLSFIPYEKTGVPYGFYELKNVLTASSAPASSSLVCAADKNMASN